MNWFFFAMLWFSYIFALTGMRVLPIGAKPNCSPNITLYGRTSLCIVYMHFCGHNPNELMSILYCGDKVWLDVMSDICAASEWSEINESNHPVSI